MGISLLLHYHTITTTGSVTAPQRSYHIPNSNTNPSSSTIIRSHSPRSGGGGGGGSSRRDSKFEPRIGVEDDGDGDEFGPRVWWSNAQERWDYDDDDDDEDEFEGFGVLEDAINVGLVFKVLKAFGWMIPAILMWVLVGNVPNTFLMALAIPIAQSAVDLMMNNETRRRKKQANKARMAKKRRDEVTRRRGRESSQTSKTAKKSSKDDAAAADSFSFGGWDELDNNNNNDNNNNAVSHKVTGKSTKEEGERRLSKRREKPLMVRLLIAAFPFLGSWMKVM